MCVYVYVCAFLFLFLPAGHSARMNSLENERKKCRIRNDQEKTFSFLNLHYVPLSDRPMISLFHKICITLGISEQVNEQERVNNEKIPIVEKWYFSLCIKYTVQNLRANIGISG